MNAEAWIHYILIFNILGQNLLFFLIFFFILSGHVKSWDSSIDLVNILKHDIRDGQLSFRGKRVLEVLYLTYKNIRFEQNI